MEDNSTEQVLAQLQEAEETIREHGHDDTVVGSLDVQALYPSLDQEQAAEAVSRFVLRSKTKITGVNWRLSQVFLASNLTPGEIKQEGLTGLLPDRRKRKGNRPGGTTSELAMKIPMDEREVEGMGDQVEEEEQHEPDFPGEDVWGSGGGCSPSGPGVAPLPSGSKTESRTKWKQTDVSGLTEENKRLIIAKVLKVAVRIIFKNHMYQFAGRTYR